MLYMCWILTAKINVYHPSINFLNAIIIVYYMVNFLINI